jgi:CHASE3 domain sensor protein
MGSTFAILAGILIVVAGIALLGVQVMESNGKEIKEHNFTLINAEVGSSKLNVETSFPGMPLIILGMCLIVIGAILPRGNK